MPQLSFSSLDYGSIAGNWMGYLEQPGSSPSPSLDRTPKVDGEATTAQYKSRGWGRGNADIQYETGPGPFGFPVAVNGAVMDFRSGRAVQPPRMRYGTYRIMDINPVIKMIRKTIAARILASSWTVKGVDSETPKQWIKLIKDMVAPIRYRFLDQAIRYMTFGWRPFEPLWTMRDGYHWLERMKALRPDSTQVLTNEHGSFTGLVQPHSQTTLRVDRYEAFKVTHDGDADEHYGQSRHEAAYDSWVHWQQTRLDQLRLSNKLAGVIPILRFPPGESSVNGVMTENSVLAQMILDDLNQASGVAVQAHEWTKTEMLRNPDVSKITNWSIDFYDAGNLAPAQMGMIATAEYDDKLMSRAWEMPERATMESTSGGARADSQDHTDTSVSTVEATDADLAEQFTSGIVNQILLVNIGQEAIDKVVVTPSPLVDRKRNAAVQMLKLLMVDPVIRTAMMSTLDVDQLIDLTDSPRKGSFSLTEAQKLQMVATTASGSSNPTGSAVSTGATNGSVVGRTAGAIAASQGLTRRELLDSLSDLITTVREHGQDDI